MIVDITLQQVYAAEVLLCGLLLIYVMQMAELDPRYADDEKWVRISRRASLSAAAVMASLTYYFGASLGTVILLGAAMLVLLINAVSFARRNSRRGQQKQVEFRQAKATIRSNRYTAFVGMITLLGATMFGVDQAQTRDDGRYANSPLKGWFDKLSSPGGGPCCSQSDGFTVEDPDWQVVADPAKPLVHYRVKLDSVWVDVPDDKVITEPNRAGKTMVWPFFLQGTPVIRCFMPGPMT